MTIVCWTVLIIIILFAMVGMMLVYYKGYDVGRLEGLRLGRLDCASEWDGWMKFKEVAVQEKLQELMQELGLESNSCVEERTENDKE